MVDKVVLLRDPLKKINHFSSARLLSAVIIIIMLVIPRKGHAQQSSLPGDIIRLLYATESTGKQAQAVDRTVVMLLREAA